MIVDLFAGPGGWDVGLRLFGVTDVLGIEIDDNACATRLAAGLPTVQDDVALLDPHDHPCDGLIASPPCQAWSMAGKRTAQADQARLGAHVERCRAGWVPYDAADYADARTPLVLEPLRWVDALRPRWVACEQVPSVADLWHHFADVLRGWGYHAWCGILNAADYGVPQTRRRAILMARRDGPVAPPEPTHAQHPEPEGLFGGAKLPWRTMAEALGWGYTDRGSSTVTGGGGATGGAEVFGHEARRAMFVAAGETGEGRPRDPDESPAATLSGKGTAYWVNGNQANSAVRSQDEPAPTIHFGYRTNDVKWHWGHESPATTIAGDSRMTGRAHHNEGEQGRDAVDVDEALAEGADPGRSVRVTVEQAAILQGFPADYPWQGSKTSHFAQVGNAVPPPLAAAICSQFTECDQRRTA